MVLLVLDRGEPAEGPVQASVVAPVDPAGSDVLDVFHEGLVGPSWKTVVAIASVLNSPMIDSIRALG